MSCCRVNNAIFFLFWYVYLKIGTNGDRFRWICFSIPALESRDACGSIDESEVPEGGG